MSTVASPRTPILRYGGWLSFVILLYLYLSLFKNALIDDAFITLQYVKTLLSSGTWGFFPGVIANSATSPLNVILLGLTSLFTGPTPEAAFWLYLVSLFFTTFVLTRLSVQLSGSTRYGWLATSALLFNPLLISTMGLESILFVALFVLALYSYRSGRWSLLGIALGLLTLTRPEGFLFLLLFLLFLPDGRRRARVALLYVLCILPWYLFSWIHLGSLVPDTFFIKTEQAIWSNRWDFFNGIPTLYFYAYLLETILAFGFLPLAGLLFLARVRQEKTLILIGLAGLIHFLGYTLLRVPPFHWYYVPEVTAMILLGSLGLGVAYRNSRVQWQRRAWEAVVILCFLVPVLGMFSILARERFVVREMPVHSNWGTREQYEAIGSWLKENYGRSTLRLVGGEIGSLAYYCDCRLLDRFSDRGWLQTSIAEHISRPGLASLLWRINFAFYSKPEFPPDDYVLRAFFAEPDMDLDIIQEWETSTKWIPRGFLILSPK